MLKYIPAEYQQIETLLFGDYLSEDAFTVAKAAAAVGDLYFTTLGFSTSENKLAAVRAWRAGKIQETLDKTRGAGLADGFQVLDPELRETYLSGTVAFAEVEAGAIAARNAYRLAWSASLKAGELNVKEELAALFPNKRKRNPIPTFIVVTESGELTFHHLHGEARSHGRDSGGSWVILSVEPRARFYGQREPFPDEIEEG